MKVSDVLLEHAAMGDLRLQDPWSKQGSSKQAFDILYWWPVADGTAGFSPPTSTGNDRPITAALVNAVLHHVSSSGQ
jgi:hypothetical protein